MPQVFISYRRDDSAGYAGRLYEALNAKLGDGVAFMDVEEIKPGEDFAAAIDTNVGACIALVAVIGTRWLTLTGESGRPRLDDPQDFVRLEIAAALRRNVPVFPVLVAGAKMPETNNLPGDLAPLAAHQAQTLGDVYFQRDATPLMEALAKLLPPPKTSIPEFAGKWDAHVTYGWGDSHLETFNFDFDWGSLSGSASYLGVDREITDGRTVANRIEFSTKSYSMLGDKTYEEQHRYRGILVGGEIQFSLQTESGYDSRKPEKFTAKRVSDT